MTTRHRKEEEPMNDQSDGEAHGESGTSVNEPEASRLLNAVQSIAIAPNDAKAFVANLRARAEKRRPSASSEEQADLVAMRIIKRYAHLAALCGSATALTGIIPGLGTAIAMVGGALGDTMISMKFQVDMCMCLADCYGYDLDNEDARHLSFMLAAGATLEKAGVETTTRIASKAGVKMLQQYLKGAVLQTLKELFKKIGITFTRKALEKALPFGIGVVIGGGANYGLTRYVGRTARKWFQLDREENKTRG